MTAGIAVSCSGRHFRRMIGALLTAGEDNLAIVWGRGERSSAPLAGRACRAGGLDRKSPNGRTLLTASADNTARIWDARGGRLLFALAGHTDHLTSAVYSPDGESVATVSRDGTARLWDTRWPPARASKPTVTLPAPPCSLLTARRRDPSAGADGLARIWDRKTGKAAS